MAKKIKIVSTEENLQNKISNFTTQNSKIFFIAALAVVLISVLIIIISSSLNSKKNKAMEHIQELEEEVIEFGHGHDDAPDFDVLLEDLIKAEKGSGFSSLKATYLIGLLYSYKEDWQNSYDYFIKTYEKDSDSYFAPVSLVNAAVSIENSGDSSKAVELYNKVLDEYEISGMGAKALFNIGRIYFTDNSIELAKSTFENLIDLYPSSTYAGLAKNILSTLE